MVQVILKHIVIIILFYFLEVVGIKTVHQWQDEVLNEEKIQFKEQLENNEIHLRISSNLSHLEIFTEDLMIHSESWSSPYNPYENYAVGLHGTVTVMVLNSQSPPAVMATKKFKTGQPTEGHYLLHFLQSLQPGRTIIVIGRPNFLKHFGPTEEQYFVSMGVTLLPKAKQMSQWVLIYTTKRTKTASSRTQNWDINNSKQLNSKEHLKRVLNFTSTFSGTIRVVDYLNHIEQMMKKTQENYEIRIITEVLLTMRKRIRNKHYGTVSMDTFVPISNEDSNCNWYEYGNLKHQKEFCHLYEGYGQLCQCEDPYVPLKKQTSKIGGKTTVLEKIPIVIVTANRPRNLYRLLRNLDLIEESSKFKKFVVIDGFNKEAVALSRLFNIEYKIHQPQGYASHNTRTNMNIGFALWSVFEHFPTATKAILLEDDLILSPDALRFFDSMGQLLDRDSSLSVVNGFGQNSFPSTAGNLSTVLRVEMYPQYGWMTTRAWAYESFTYWVKEGKDIDWDWWLFNEGPKRGKDAIVPEVSRIGHAGSVGAHVTGMEQSGFFNAHIISSVTDVKMNFEKISPPDVYDKWMDEQIRMGIKVQLKTHPCAHFDVLNRSEVGPFVLFLGVSSREDNNDAFMLLQACLGTDERDVKQLYNGVLQLNISNYTLNSFNEMDNKKLLYLVGCPISKYCKYSERKKDWIIPTKGMAEQARDFANEKRFDHISDLIRFRKQREKNLTKDYLEYFI